MFEASAVSKGNSDLVQDQLRNVKFICACDRTFAALRRDGTIVTWGALELKNALPSGLQIQSPKSFAST